MKLSGHNRSHQLRHRVLFPRVPRAIPQFHFNNVIGSLNSESTGIELPRVTCEPIIDELRSSRNNPGIGSRTGVNLVHGSECLHFLLTDHVGLIVVAFSRGLVQSIR